MPFTASHAAAVLPAVRGDGTGRGRLVPSVLVAGSFAPDMTYYAASLVPGAMEFGRVTHSFPGALTLDVLVAWTLVGLWLTVREPLVALLPAGRQGRPAALLRCGAPRARPRPSLVARWYASAVLGALTHVVWDAFTHHSRWGARMFPVLEREFAGSPLYWYLQYGGSAVAAVVIALFLLRALRGMPDVPRPAVPSLSARDRWWALALFGGCAATGAVVRAVRWWAYWGAVAKPWELIPTVCFGAGAGLLLALPLYAMAARTRRQVRAPGGTAGPEADGDAGAGAGPCGGADGDTGAGAGPGTGTDGDTGTGAGPDASRGRRVTR
ncbi:DUF4184 family protein [Streptomyces sp. SHP 1-2]|uniref:DUF4184 family protein n=1 Tax=Streptomyces sp. SHP 1-2 TaxID=2769489 RepID=UPI002238A532|nr:DUF4184 family protein [Streptomyces sp. SHP 1-2]MCW5249373.1 DUF4184 family protein [Streptomyces sp. SHP 1-2]